MNEVEEYFKNTKQVQEYISDLTVSQQNEILEYIKTMGFNSPSIIRSVLDKVTVSRGLIGVYLSKYRIKRLLYSFCTDDKEIIEPKEQDEDIIEIMRDVKISTGTSKGGNKLIIKDKENSENDLNETLIKTVVRSFYWQNLFLSGNIKNTKDIQKLENLKDDSYIKQILNLRFLSPKIIDLILNGIQPRDLTVSKLFDIKTLNWRQQEQLLGIN